MVAKIVIRSILIGGVIGFLLVGFLPHIESDAAGYFIEIAIIASTVALVMYFDFKRMQKKYSITEEQKRYMLFGGLLLAINNETNQTFRVVNTSKGKARALLRDWWGITTSTSAIDTAGDLSKAQMHTGFADDVYNNLVIKDIFNPTHEDLQKLRPENAAQVDRIRHGLFTCSQAVQSLKRIGYTESDFAEIKTLAAWDYGRTTFVARFSAHSKIMTATDAWIFIQKAAENAEAAYDSWKQYLAAYVLGRCIAYGEFLPIGANVFNQDSAYSRTPFKYRDIPK